MLFDEVIGCCISAIGTRWIKAQELILTPKYPAFHLKWLYQEAEV